MMRILLTGANGFLGTLISQALKKAGNHITDFPFDIRDQQAIRSFFSQQSSAFDLAIHLAAMSHVPECEKEPQLARDINVTGTMNFAAALLEHSPKSRLIFFSSAQIYDWQKIQMGEQASETFPTNPTNIYAETKMAAEEGLSRLYRQMPNQLAQLRLFNHTHCSQSPSFFLPSVYQQILKGQSSGHVQLSLGETSFYRDIGAVQDLLSAILLLAENPWKNSVYNICSGSAKKLSDLIEELSRALHVRTEVSKNPQFIRKSDPPWICGSFSRFQNDFGWSPKRAQTAPDLIAAFLDKIG